MKFIKRHNYSDHFWFCPACHSAKVTVQTDGYLYCFCCGIRLPVELDDEDFESEN